MADSVLGRLAIEISANATKFLQGLNQSSGALNKFGAQMKAQQNAFGSFQKSMQGVSGALSSLGVGFGAFTVFQGLKDVIVTAKDFETAIDRVAAISGATGDQLEALRQDALRLGAATEYTATEVAGLQTELGRLGFSSTEITDATEAILDLATATGEDLAKSAEVAGQTVRAFGFDASKTGKVADVMALSFSRSALNLDRFQESMKFVAPVSKAAGISIEETTALLGALADAGISGSQAGTSLKRIITDLAKDGRPLRDRLQELADKGLTFSGAMDEVGRIAQTSLLVLADNTDKVSRLTDEFSNAAGAAKRMADIMRDNLQGDLDKLSSAWEGLVLAIQTSNGSLREAVQRITEVVNIITEFVKSNEDLISGLLKIGTLGPRIFLEIAGAIIDAIQAIKELGKEYSGLASAAKFAGEALNFIVDSIIDIVTFVPRATAALIDLFKPLRGEFDLTEKEAGELFAKLKAAITEANRIGDAQTASTLSFQLQKLIEQFGDLSIEAGYLGPELAEVFGLPASLISKFNASLSATPGLVSVLEGKIKDLQDSIKNATSVSDLRNFQRQLEGAQIQLEKLLNPTAAPQAVNIPVTFDVQTTDAGISEFISGLTNEISANNPDGIVVPVNVEIPEEDADKIKVQFEGITTTIGDSIDEISQRMKNLREAVNATFRQGIQNVLVGFAEDLGNVAAGVGNFGDNIIKALAGFAKQFGALLISAGLAKIAFDNLKFSGYGAVAAGVALIAAAQAVSSSISGSSGALASGGGGSRSLSESQQVTIAQPDQVVTFEGQVEVVASGSNLIGVINSQNIRDYRTRG